MELREGKGRIEQPAERHNDTLVRLEAIPNIVPALVHRLNNALGVLRGLVEMPSDRLPGDRLELARRQIERMSTSLRWLSNFSRARAESASPFDLEACVRGALVLLEPLASERGVVLSLSAGAARGVLRGDEVRFLQQFVTLLTREILAIASTSGGRRLRISIAARGEHAVLKWSTERAPSPSLDSGPQERDAFAGQPLVDHRTRQLSGRLSTRRFVFRAESLQTDPARAPREGGRAARILVVVPDRTMGELLGTVLDDEGHSTEVVHDGDAALEALVRGEHQLVLLDADLGELGPGFLAALRRTAASRARFALLGRYPGSDAGGSMRALQKPFRPHELVAFVNAELG